MSEGGECQPRVFVTESDLGRDEDDSVARVADRVVGALFGPQVVEVGMHLAENGGEVDGLWP